jgi:tRNA pseudouridine38-40 synthase
MPRYRLTLEYDGGPFQGWQRQANGPSVQAAIERAVHAFSGETVTVTGAGRTDTGVHALGQIAHLDLERPVVAARLMMAVNHHLRPDPIVVLEARDAAPDFHARFWATSRRYLYRILNRRSLPALDAGRVWHVPVPLDHERMHAAAQALVGRHDFTSYRASECQALSPIKTLDRLWVEREGDQILIHAVARSFLHHQVRNMVGTLELVGAGREPLHHAERALAVRSRAAAGPTAPARGLYLVSVTY